MDGCSRFAGPRPANHRCRADPLFMQQRSPIARHTTLGAWDRLIERMSAGWYQFCARNHGVFFVVVEPLLTRFEAGNDRMAAHFGMPRGVLPRRAIATADVTALRAAPQVQPPPGCCQAFHAAVSARLRRRVDAASVRGLLLHGVAPLGLAATSASSYLGCSIREPQIGRRACCLFPRR